MQETQAVLKKCVESMSPQLLSLLRVVWLFLQVVTLSGSPGPVLEEEPHWAPTLPKGVVGAGRRSS